MVLFFISIHIFAKRGLASFAENVFSKQDKFAYKTEIWAVRPCQIARCVKCGYPSCFENVY